MSKPAPLALGVNNGRRCAPPDIERRLHAASSDDVTV